MSLGRGAGCMGRMWFLLLGRLRAGMFDRSLVEV